LYTDITGSRVDWRLEILPLQWRTTITWLIGSFAFTLFVPVLFKYHGSVIAGQMGMTLSLICAVSAVSSAWLNPNIPQLGMLIAKKKYKDLDKLFWQTAKIFITIAVLGTVAVWITVYTLNVIRHSLAARFLPLLPTGIFLLAVLVSAISVPFSTYLRVHKKEPLLFSSVAVGVSVGLATFFLGKYYSAIGMAVGYLSVNLVMVPVVFVIWYRCRIEWHKDECVDSEII